MAHAGQNDDWGCRIARGRWLLVAGASTGIVLAAVGILRDSAVIEPSLSAQHALANVPEPLPPDAVARVNGRLIPRNSFEQVLALDVAEGAVADASTKQRIVDRMIDEELRVQRALELKLHLTDGRVRMDLSSAVAEAATAAAEREPPDEAALRTYFEKNREYFAQRGPLRMQHIWVAIVGGNLGEAYTRARTATTLLRDKESFEVVKEIAGNSAPRPVPGQLLSPDELSRFIGRDALNVALTLQPGEVSDPIRTTDGFHVLRMLERHRRENPSFETCRLDVAAAVWTERMREALTANAAELRKTATIVQTDSLP